MAASGQGYAAGRFAVELEGSITGYVASVAGGEPFADVRTDPTRGGSVDKVLGRLRYEPLVLAVDDAAGAPFLNWVAAMPTGQGTPKDGAILILDYNNRVQRRLEWTAGVVGKLVIPAASGSATGPARLEVTLNPEETELQPGSGATVPVAAGRQSHKQSRLSSFRWTVAGLAAACTRTREVSAVTVRRGDNGQAEVDNLTFVVPETDAAPFRAWFSQLVARPSDERAGELAFLDAAHTTDQLRIDLAGLGVCRVSSARQESGAAALAVATVELYCESLTMTSAAGGSTPGGGQGGTTGTATPESTEVAATSDRSVDRLAAVLADLLTDRAGPSISSAADIAGRLRRSAEVVASDDSAAPVAAEQGRAAGRAWASEVAGLAELEAVASLAGRDDWSTLALDEDHSLVAFLGRRAILDPALPAPAGLDRDEFIAGLVAGAAEVQREVAPLLEQRPPG